MPHKRKRILQEPTLESRSKRAPCELPTALPHLLSTAQGSSHPHMYVPSQISPTHPHFLTITLHFAHVPLFPPLPPQKNIIVALPSITAPPPTSPPSSPSSENANSPPWTPTRSSFVDGWTTVVCWWAPRTTNSST